jgi:hypothetical protein
MKVLDPPDIVRLRINPIPVQLPGPKTRLLLCWGFRLLVPCRD